MSSSDENECPLCMETLDVDDLSFFPCTCHYQICRFCWHRIRTDENGLCPACRKPYTEDPVTFKPLTPEEFQQIKMQKKRELQRKRCGSDNRKHLANLRVVQKNLVFAVGLSPRLADPDILRKQDYFGKFGKIVKVVMNHALAGGQAKGNGPSASAYITYARAEDALKAIHSVNNVQIDGRTIKTSLGTTKYCSMFLKHQSCNKSDCMYLHEIGDEAASFTKEDMNQGKHTEYEKRLYEQMMNQLNAQTNGSHDPKSGGYGASGFAGRQGGANAEPCPIPSQKQGAEKRPGAGTSPIEIPVLPAKQKSKNRRKDNRPTEGAQSLPTKTASSVPRTVSEDLSRSARMSKSGQITAAAVVAGTVQLGRKRGSGQRRSASSEASSGVEPVGEDSGSDGNSSPPLSSVPPAQPPAAPTPSEVAPKRDPSPAASPAHILEILGEDGNRSSGYASGSSASSSLHNSSSVYCAQLPTVIPSEAESSRPTPAAPSSAAPPPPGWPQTTPIFTGAGTGGGSSYAVETSIPLQTQQDNFRQQDYHALPNLPESTSTPGDFDDLGFDPFAETQKAFAEILDNEANLEGISDQTPDSTLVMSQTSIRCFGMETKRPSVPPGFGPEPSALQFDNFMDPSSTSGSKILPFLLKNQASYSEPERQSQPPPGLSMMEKLLSGMGSESIHQYHPQQQQQQQQHHHQQHQFHQPMHHQAYHSMPQKTMPDRRETMPDRREPQQHSSLSFLRSRGVGQTQSPPQHNSFLGLGMGMGVKQQQQHQHQPHQAGSSPQSNMFSWREWEDSLNTLFPSSLAGSGQAAGGIKQPPGLGAGGMGPSDHMMDRSNGVAPSSAKSAQSRLLEGLMGPQPKIPSGDWLEMDPAIVSTSRHFPQSSMGSQSMAPPSVPVDSGRQSPPSWLIQSLEQLTNDSPPDYPPAPLHHFNHYRGNGPPGFPPPQVPHRQMNPSAPPGLGPYSNPPPGFGAGGINNIPHSFQSPFAPRQGGQNPNRLQQELFDRHRGVLES